MNADLRPHKIRTKLQWVVKNYVDNSLGFFNHLPPYVDIFYGINIDKKGTFLDYLPTLSCNRTLFVNGP
jgi:hypothetical protein